MAKVGFWLQGSTGKLAGSALQKGANGTIIRQIVKPKNPKTANQILQRVLMNSVSQGYSALQPIVCHAFQGKTEGAECQKTFMSENLAYFRNRAASLPEEQLSAFVNFVPVGQKGIRPSAYIVSAGSLPRVPVSIINTGAVLTLSANTYQAVIDDYDLKRGDQLTFITIYESLVNEGEYIAKWSRVILDPRNEDGTEAPLSSAFVVNDAINLPNSKNAGNFGYITDVDAGIQFDHKAGALVCAAGIIVSRLDGDEWKRSNCQLVVSEANIGDKGISLARAIEISRSRSSIYMEDANQYLDNAGVSGGQSSDSGSSEEPGGETTPVLSNTVNIGGVSQNVAGGSVDFTGALTAMQFTGSNLAASNVVVKKSGVAAGTVTAASATQLNWAGELAVGESLTVYKNINGTETQWFTVTAISGGGGGSDES